MMDSNPNLLPEKLEVFRNAKEEFFINAEHIIERGKLPRKTKGCKDYIIVKYGNSKRKYIHNPDFFDDDVWEDYKYLHRGW